MMHTQSPFRRVRGMRKGGFNRCSFDWDVCALDHDARILCLFVSDLQPLTWTFWPLTKKLSETSITDATGKLTLGFQSTIKVIHQNSGKNDGDEKHDDREHSWNPRQRVASWRTGNTHRKLLVISRQVRIRHLCG